MTRKPGLAVLIAALLWPLSAPAQHVDLGTDLATEASTPADMPRRFMMEDTYGVVMTNEDFAGRFAMIYFGYTGCPDVCPTTLATLTEVMAGLTEAEAARVVPVFVTVDPDRDSAKLLRDYLGFFDTRFVGLRGPKDYTDHMVRAFNARYEIHRIDPDDPLAYSIDHTASVALIGPDGHLIRRFPHGTSPADILTLLRGDLEAVQP